jgi:O-antigen ligase
MIMKNSIIKNKSIIFFVILLGISLNQAIVISGINHSLSDLFFIVIIMILLFKRQLFFPIETIMCFLIISITALFAAGILVPNKFAYTSSLIGMIYGHLKLGILFMYLILGYNLARLNLSKRLIKWFSVSSLFIGFISVVFIFINIDFLSNILFFGELRFKGFMNDPNYFSILQIVSIAYFINTKNISKNTRYLAIVILIISVLMSGSKTGILTLLIYIGIKIIEVFIECNINKKSFLKKSGVVIVGISLLLLLSEKLANIILFLTEKIPAFGRVSVIFFDINSAISTGGSSRDATWQMASELIRISPLFGLGLGTYTEIITNVFNYRSIAHNTYLQLAVEWGLPLTILFFMFIFYLIIKITIYEKNNSDLIVFRDIIIVFLVGSLAISFNNARLFWIILGGLLYNINMDKKNRRKRMFFNEEN